MTARKVYLSSVFAVLAASIYPIRMGNEMVVAYFRDGGIDAANYPSYIIPYTPVCIAVILCVYLIPTAQKLCGKFSLAALSALGIATFLAAETAFEQIAVFTDVSAKMNVETWQLLSCAVTPQVRDNVWDSLNIRYSPAFKLHFYAIALLIVITTVGVLHGFYSMARTGDFSRKKPLTAQLVCVLLFIGLCILACLTAFFRTGDIRVSPLSAVLMTLFFLTFGITAGVYTGTITYGKRAMLSQTLPCAVSVLVAILMYIGEMVMMGWNLFRFGGGILFSPIGAFPLAPFDLLTILASGALTFLILRTLRPAAAKRAA